MAGEDKSNKNLARELEKIKNILEDSDERFHQLMDLYPELIIVVTEEEIVYVNEAVVKYIRLNNKDNLLGKPALSFIHPDIHKEVMERIKNIQNGKYLRPVSEKLVLMDGIERDVEVTGIPLSKNLGNLTGREVEFGSEKLISLTNNLHIAIFNPVMNHLDVVTGAPFSDPIATRLSILRFCGN